MRYHPLSNDDRAAMLRTPPDILITTPESLYLLLTSRARDILGGVEAVIVDEIHAVARDKRGAHLALSLERLEALCERHPVRIGLSATQRPIDLVGQLLVGDRPPPAVVDVGHRPPQMTLVNGAHAIVDVDDDGSATVTQTFP